MKPSIRTRVNALPVVKTAWELELVRMPIDVPDVDVVGVAVFVDAKTGKVRIAVPMVRGAAPIELVLKALFEPNHGKPARPLSIRCVDYEVCDELKFALRDVPIRVERVPEVPHARAAADELFARLMPPTSPGVTEDLPLWSATLTALCEAAPWETLCDSVTFRFHGAPDLDDAVLILLGLAGEQRGVVLYHSTDSYDLFLDFVATQDPSLLEGLIALQAYLDPADEFESSEREACAHAGLELPGGLLPRIGLMAGGDFRNVNPHGQRTLLAAIQAVLALCRTGLREIDVAPQQAHVDTCLGRLLVRSTPSPLRDAPPPSLIQADHAILVGFLGDIAEATAAPVPTLVLKMGKRDAVQARPMVAAVDAVELSHGVHGVRFLAYGNGALLGSLGVLPRLDPLYAASDRVQIVVSSGGAQRTTLLAKDVQHVCVVPMRSAEGAGAPRVAVADPIFAGPPELWPKVSETLIAFAEAVTGPRLRGLTSRQAEETLKVAAAVWCAVVLADVKGEPGVLDQLRGLAGESSVIIEALVRVKRERFASDPRIIVLRDVKVRGGELHVEAEGRL